MKKPFHELKLIYKKVSLLKSYVSYFFSKFDF